MTPITLITSGAYVNSEIAAEYGSLPPSFLPIGHSRLYSLQISSATDLGGRVALTVPSSFVPSVWDLGEIRGRGVELVKVPDDLSLGESIRYALAVTGAAGPVRILHGDTAFLDKLPLDLDFVSIAASTPYSYSWGLIDSSGMFSRGDAAGSRGRPVMTGYFSFANGAELVRALTISRGDFIEALNLYRTSTSSFELKELAGWLDCGHLQTFYRARAHITTARSFNSVKISGRVVQKSSSNDSKIRMEANWFESIPEMLRLYCPRYLGSNNEEKNFSYKIAYEYSPTLHELFVFGKLGQPFWRQIMKSTFDFLDECSLYSEFNEPDIPLSELVVEKTGTRLDSFARASNTDLDRAWVYAGRPLPSLSRIAEIAGNAIAPRRSKASTIMHGDLCFPNIFYDFREQSIKVIDPRGFISTDKPSIFGDVRYDLAKLNHSIEGYDFILANKYIVDKPRSHELTISFPDDAASSLIGRIASEFSAGDWKLTDSDVSAITIHLFLSMLPLHADRPDRQQAFIANALRLFLALDH